MKAAAFDYHRASDAADALAVLAAQRGDAKVLAGGCSLGPLLNLRLARPGALVDVRALPELRGQSQTATSLVIGACRTHAEIEDGVVPDVTRGFMPRVARGIAYRPIRNRGTIGGSLAHADPAADWVSAMVVLDATIHIRSQRGERREAAASFVTAPFTTLLADDEIIAAVEVPSLSPSARWSYHKISRKTGDFALAIGAAVVDPKRDTARVVCGAVETAPVILSQTSAALKRSAGEALALVAADIDRLLPGHDHVFRQLHVTAVERAIRELAP